MDTTRRRGPGRPPNPDGPNPTPSTSVRIPRDLRARVDDARARRGDSLADAIIWGLRAYVARGDD